MPTSNTLPEGYLERREELQKRNEEIQKRNTVRAAFAAGINRFLEDGIRKYTKHDLGALGFHDWPFIQTTLADWELRGLVRIVKPLDHADDSDVVIKILRFVDAEEKFKLPDVPTKPV